MPPITLSSLYIYPIKSAAGIALSSAQIEPRGLNYDRRWMLVDQARRFMTQRRFPRMALIEVRLKTDHLAIAAPGMPPLAVPLQPPREPLLSVEVWGDICGAIPLTDEINDWFTRFLEVRCQLVYMPDHCDRTVRHPRTEPSQPVSFADSFPFLLISEASLQDLNQRLTTPVPMNRFRPNLVVTGCDAFAEDTWDQIQIGDVTFQVAKPCSRCKVITVNQKTGDRSPEPLLTLGKYRLWEGQIWFGQNLLQEQLGQLQLGDTVEVLQIKPKGSDPIAQLARQNVS